jgi:serine/threonine-protein kinase
MIALQPDLVIAERYKLKEPIGSGGMGAVWAAEHVGLGHTVAIKFLGVSVSSTDDARQRFSREGRIAAQLGEQSRHICRVFDHGVLDDGTPFIVMERLAGEGLNQRLRRERRLTSAVAIEIVDQLCRALAVAHEAGVVHRDLKPANVFLCEDRDGVYVKLLDFGVAKARLESDAGTITADGTLVGTPSYMSPEQFENSARVDARSDLWAVAAMTYRMIIGLEPFSAAGGLSALAMRIAAAEPTPPTLEIPTLPAAFDAFIAKGLAKAPGARFQGARELSAAFAAAIRGVAPATTDAVVASSMDRPLPATAPTAQDPPSLLAVSAVTDAPNEAPASKRSGAKTALAIVLALAVVGGGAALALSRSGGAREATAPASGSTSAGPARSSVPSSEAATASATTSASASQSVAAAATASPPAAASSGAITRPVGRPATSAAPTGAPAADATKAKDSWNNDTTL